MSGRVRAWALSFCYEVLLTMPYLKAALVADFSSEPTFPEEWPKQGCVACSSCSSEVTIVVIGEFVATYFNEDAGDGSFRPSLVSNLFCKPATGNIGLLNAFVRHPRPQRCWGPEVDASV